MRVPIRLGRRGQGEFWLFCCVVAYRSATYAARRPQMNPACRSHPAPRISPLTGSFDFARDAFHVIAGPCAVESQAQVQATADAVAAAGATILRGGAFKPRTSPKSFQGLGVEGLELLRDAGKRVGLPVVTEVLDPRDVELVSAHADALQVGSRNMQNFPLLREIGQTRHPVLIKRGAAATLKELLGAAEYILAGGNERVVLCERGLRGFDPSTRYLLDLGGVAALRTMTDLPIVVDPSHAAGRADLVPDLARAAVAVGADGLMIEVHPDPGVALSDGAQALTTEQFVGLMADVRALLAALGTRQLATKSVGMGPNCGSNPEGTEESFRVSRASSSGSGETSRPDPRLLDAKSPRTPKSPHSPNSRARSDAPHA